MGIIVEWYGVKCFGLGVFITAYLMRKRNKRPPCFEIKEV
jgi:hypothetical protein